MNSYREEFRAENGVLHVRLSGAFPNDRLSNQENLFAPLVEACNQVQCRLAIVDARELQVGFDTAALFRAGVDAAALNRFGLWVALVARQDMLSPFFDDVIRNRGARVEVFTDMEGARAWVSAQRPESDSAASASRVAEG